MRSILRAITRVGVFPFANCFSSFTSAGVHGLPDLLGFLAIGDSPMSTNDIETIQQVLDELTLALPEGYTWPADLRQNYE